MRHVLAPIAAFGLVACVSAAWPSGDDLAARVQRLEDARDIREVLVRYGEYLDAKDYAGYASLFAADGVSTTGFGSATGPQAIEALLAANMGLPPSGYVNAERFHLMTTMTVEPAGDSATARSRYTVFEASANGAPAVVHAGRYVDALVREQGAWKIRRRTSYGVIPYRAPPPGEAR